MKTVRWVVVGLALLTLGCEGAKEVAPGSAEGPEVPAGSTSAADTGAPATSTTADSGATTTGSSGESTTGTTGPGDTTEGADDSSGSTTTAVDEETSGGTTGDQTTASLEPLRMELPCMAGSCQFNTAHVCFTVAEDQASTTLVGEPGNVYDVTLRIRGLVEMADYGGGTLDGDIYVGGDATSLWNPFRLTVSDPAETYWLNPLGSGSLFAQPVDVTYTVPIAAGATVNLWGSSGDDSCIVFNKDAVGDPVVVDGVPPAPAPFDGQFIQVDSTELVVR